MYLGTVAPAWFLKLLSHVDVMPRPFWGGELSLQTLKLFMPCSSYEVQNLFAFLQTLCARWVQVLAAKRSTIHPITRLLLMVCAITGIVILSSHIYIYIFKSHFLLFKGTFCVCFSVCVQFGWEKKAWRSSDRSQGWWGCSVTSLAGYISV